MATKYVVDAHALVWYIENNPRLGKSARAVLDDRTSALFLPVIALAEACRVVEKGKCNIPTVRDLLKDVKADPRIKIVPLNESILLQSVLLIQPSEMHDRQIVATAMRLRSAREDVYLLTCDPEITASGLVNIIWD